MGRLGGAEFIVLALLAVLLFGAKRLPGGARSMGEALHAFKKSLREGKGDPDQLAQHSTARDPASRPGA
jgi:TatA/E family protein of Tat protein translocase